MATLEEIQARTERLKKLQAGQDPDAQVAQPEQPAEPEEEKSALEAIASAPAAVAGLVAGGIEGLASGAYGAVTGSGEAYNDSYKRHEELFKERAGKEVYENTVADLKDIATSIPVMANAVWNAMWKKDTFSATKEMGEDIGEDAIVGMRWSAANYDKAFKAYPVSMVLMLTQAGKIAQSAGRIGKASKLAQDVTAPLQPIADKINAIMDKDVGDFGLPDAIKRERKLVDTEQVPGTLYTRAIGDEGLKLKDLVKPGLYATGTGMLVGAGELGAVLGLAGPYLTGVMAKNSRRNKDIAGAMGRLLQHTSKQSRMSDEVAIRALFQHAPQASAALDTAAIQLSDAIKAGVDFSDQTLSQIADSSGLRELMDIQPSYAFRDADGRLVKNLADGASSMRRARTVARGKIDRKTADALTNVQNLINEASDDSIAGFTMAALDDLLSGDSVQYARDAKVMAKVINKVRELDPSLSNDKLRKIQELVDKVSYGPVYRQSLSINPRLRIGGQLIDVRSLVTEQWKTLDLKERAGVAASVATSLLEQNKAIMRSKAAAKALDGESMRVFRSNDDRRRVTQELLDSDDIMERQQGMDIYGDALLESVFLQGSSVPMVSPRGLNFNRLAERLDNRFIDNPVAFRKFLDERIKDRDVTDAEFANAQSRLAEVFEELSDVANEDRDLGKMGSELARSIAADGLEDNRVLQYMRALESEGLITPEDFKSVASNGLSEAFGINLQTKQDSRSIRSPLARTYGWLENSLDNSPLGPTYNSIGAHLKGAYTIYNPASHVNNAVSNMGLIALDRAIDPITALVQTFGSAQKMREWRQGKKFSDRDNKIYDKVSKMGFGEGDIITAEIRALGHVDVGYGKSAPVVTTADLMRRFAGSTVGAAKDMASKTYRLGDVVFKQDEAIRRMNTVIDAVDALNDGEYIDIPTSAAAVRRIRKENGKIITPGKGDIYDVAAAYGRMKANELFFDYSQRPGLLRLADKAGGTLSIINPYLTWYWKALGIGGDGLFKRINNADLEFNTNNTRVLGAQLRSDVFKFARRAIVMNGMRSEFEKHPEELQRAMSFMPNESKQVLFTDMADPNVMSFRDISSMNFLDPFSTATQMVGTVLGRLSGSERSEILSATGEQDVGKDLLQLVGLTGSPAVEAIDKFRKGRLTVEDVLSPLLGVGLAQTVLSANRALDGIDSIAGMNMSSFDKLMAIDPEVRPKAMDYYFRRISSIGWNKDYLFGKAGNRPGKLTRYMTTLKRNLKQNLVTPKLADAREGAASAADVQEALVLANEMYRRRLQELFDATSKVYPDFRFPEGVVKPITIRKTDL